LQTRYKLLVVGQQGKIEQRGAARILDEWINGTESRRIPRVSHTTLLRLAVLGRLRTRLEPGFAVQSNRTDVESGACERDRLQVAA
jgi:hypothetical protein